MARARITVIKLLGFFLAEMCWQEALSRRQHAAQWEQLKKDAKKTTMWTSFFTTWQYVWKLTNQDSMFLQIV